MKLQKTSRCWRVLKNGLSLSLGGHCCRTYLVLVSLMQEVAVQPAATPAMRADDFLSGMEVKLSSDRAL